MTATASPKTKKPRAKKPVPEPTFDCTFCKQSFKRETTLVAHVCEQKRRDLDRNEQHVKLGFWVYRRFYSRNYRMKTERTFESFRTSQMYLDFVKFGRYLLDINAINTTAFVDFILDANIKIGDWRKPLVYESYLRELNKKETPEAALERNFLLMQQWSDETGEPWTEFFRKIATPLATHWIRSGRISPWVLYTASSGSELLARMSDEQIGIIEAAIEPAFWMPKLEQAADAIAAIREELDAAGL